MRFVIIFLLLVSSCYAQQLDKPIHQANSAAKKLNDSAVYIALHFNEFDYAVELLDKATAIDSNYFEAYRNKMSFQGLIKPFDSDKILGILKSLNHLRPQDPQYYMNIGMIYYEKGELAASSNYFNDALLHFNSILDTLPPSSEAYAVLVLNKAYTLFIQGQDQKAHDLLVQLYETTKDSVAKELILPALQKKRKDIIAELMSSY